MVGPDAGKMHDMRMAGVPESPWDEVVHNLFVGSSEMGYPAGEFDAVVSVFDWHYDRLSWLPKPGTPHLVMPFYDDSSLPAIEWMDMIADFIHLFHSRNLSVLVRCQAGLNRSSLAAAHYMCKYLHLSGAEAIDAIRTARSADCLFNRHFVKWLNDTHRHGGGQLDKVL